MTLVTIPLAAQPSELVQFEMKDQFDTVHSHGDYAGRILIVIGSDRRGSEFHDDWEVALRDSLNAGGSVANVAFLSVAEVRGVPFFLKGSVKGKFSRDPDEWILVDWKGFFAETYGFEPDATNMLLFAANGTLVSHTRGRELDWSKVSAIVATVRRLAEDAPS